jgi:hypothetical protein
MATITINGITVDPLTPPQAPAARAMLDAMSPNDASNFDYILVQTTHALNQEEKKQLEDAGASILEYVPEDTYLCHFPPTDLISEPWADTTSHSGKMIMTVFAGIAEFERDLIRERTAAGREAAKKRGVRFGRPRKLALDQNELARRLVSG